MSLGRTTRLQVGSVAWIEEERNAAQQLIEAEVEEFTFSARNELDWLNEHMAEIFDENQLYVLIYDEILQALTQTEMLQRYLRRRESSVARRRGPSSVTR